ncbi:MAG TPA: helix-turn-helix domain-containing protein [Nocardioidaceae bacterium]|nr:helix-turn-helix domain-containing protein [Nocardioidaceae bacterium]
MLSALDVLTSIGPSTFEVMVPGARRDVADVFLAEPGGDAVGQAGDLVLGAGCSAEEAVDLVRRCAAAGASGLVLRSTTVGVPVLAVAREQGLLLATVQPDVSWAHLVWMLRGVVDRAAAPDAPTAGDAAVHQDLFAVADTVAAIVDAPVTIEDNRSRVLAYSSGQASTDPARVSTIVGRRVPEEVLASLRARGVFRTLAKARAPFLVPAGPDGTLPRLVVPVRAGEEWLGSIWAVVQGPVPERVTAELNNAASVLALHLLRLRAQADVARRDAVERLRRALTGTGTTDPALRFPEGPWRVVALAAPSPTPDLSQRVDLWATTLRRNGWAEPALTDVDGIVHAVVGTGATPGSWAWLRGVTVAMHRADPAVVAAAGAPAATPAELPRSRGEAAETLRLLIDEGAAAGCFEDSWAPLVVARAAGRLQGAQSWGPVGTLLAVDRERGTAYVETLAAWLAHRDEPSRAAAVLHVHPNTLRHRMRRVAELVDLDLDDATATLALRLQTTGLQREALQQGQQDRRHQRDHHDRRRDR